GDRMSRLNRGDLSVGGSPGSSLIPVVERADDGADDSAGKEVHRRFATELVARAALDQPRSKTALDRSCDRRPAGLGPGQPQLTAGGDLPIERHGTGVVGQRAILRRIS